MTDSNSSNQSPTSRRSNFGPLSRIRGFARRGRDRLTSALQQGVDQLGRRLYDQLLDVLSSPDQLQRLQRLLANVAGWTMRRGFRADPNAKLLFEFVDWLDDRHGRQKISAILFQSRMLQDPAFLEAMGHLSKSLNPWLDDSNDNWDASRIDRFKKRAGDRLLELLVELAALESDEPAPSGPPQQQIEYFKNAPIPARFTRLAAMTRGEELFDRRSPTEQFRVVKSITDQLNSDPDTDSALSRHIPAMGDKTLHFLVLSTTFFLQSYLLRNLIEALPEMAQQLTRRLRDDDLIDVH